MSDRQQALIQFTRDLVQIPSVLGDENRVAERVVAEMKFLGFDTVEVDSAGSVVGVIECGSEEPVVLLDAHMDTVDVYPRDAWARDPFGGDLEDGCIWGRGSSDMKGALAAMQYGASQIDRERLDGRVVVSASVGEELIEGAAMRTVMQRFGGDFVIIGEASQLDLVRAGRGRAEFVISTHGRPAHAASPELGDNAVHRMRAVIEEIERLPMPRDEFVGPGIMCLTDIISIPHPAHSVVPSGCRATYERRTVPGETQEQLVQELREACERAGEPDSDVDFALTDYTSYTGVHWERPKWFAPWQLQEDHPVVQAAARGLRSVGLEPAMKSYQFCTNAAYSAGYAGIPTVGFGPGREDQAHVIDEHLEVSQLLAAAHGYRGIIEELLRA